MWDGADDQSSTPIPVSSVPKERSNEPPMKFVFSPDSKHIVWFGPVGNANGVHLDGKVLTGAGNQIFNRTFTPDSRHLFWMSNGLNEPKYIFYLDGIEVLKIDFQNLMVAHPYWWEVGPDGVLTAAIIDQGSVKRIRITPGAETSVETMLANLGHISRHDAIALLRHLRRFSQRPVR